MNGGWVDRCVLVRSAGSGHESEGLGFFHRRDKRTFYCGGRVKERYITDDSKFEFERQKVKTSLAPASFFSFPLSFFRVFLPTKRFGAFPAFFFFLAASIVV